MSYPMQPQKPAAMSRFDERSGVRRAADLPGELHRLHRDPVPVSIQDISIVGCKIATPQQLSIGSFVTLRLTDSVTFDGWVVWSWTDTAGVSFAHPPQQLLIDTLLAGQGETDRDGS